MENPQQRAEELHPGYSWVVADVSPEDGPDGQPLPERVRIIVSKHVLVQETQDVLKSDVENMTDEGWETAFADLVTKVEG